MCVCLLVTTMMVLMLTQWQVDGARWSGWSKDCGSSETPHQLIDVQSTSVPVPMPVPMHLQNGRRAPHDGHVYHRPFENDTAVTRPPDWTSSSFQTQAATTRVRHSQSATSRDFRTRRPESKPAAMYGCLCQLLSSVHLRRVIFRRIA